MDVSVQDTFYSFHVLAVTFEGIEEWFIAGNRNVEATLTSIGGFPAAEFHFLDVENEGCTLAIDVKDKQYLQVEMVPTSAGFKQDQICQMSEQAGEMAIATLQTLR